MTPFLSFCFPVAPNAVSLELLRRSVTALRAQTDRSFEVVVGVDGGAPEQVEQALGDVMRELDNVRLVASPRTPGNEHLPHRNHARNAACRVARGAYLWVVDCDHIPDACAVEHARAVVASTPRPLVLSPCIAEPACTPAEWMEDPEGHYALVKKTGSSQLHRYRPGRPWTAHHPRLPEGVPALPGWLYEALGGFDERYLGWGGNKIELCRRCRFLDLLEGLVEVHVLGSALFRHQPHEKDPLHFHRALREHNTEMFERMQREITAGAAWWREQVSRVRAALPQHEAVRRAAGGA